MHGDITSGSDLPAVKWLALLINEMALLDGTFGVAIQWKKLGDLRKIPEKDDG
jgi:hypothetical protein